MRHFVIKKKKTVKRSKAIRKIFETFKLGKYTLKKRFFSFVESLKFSLLQIDALSYPHFHKETYE